MRPALDYRKMFSGAEAFNQKVAFNTSKVTDMKYVDTPRTAPTNRRLV